MRVELSGRCVLAFKAFFKYAVVVFVRLVAPVVWEQAVGQAVGVAVLFNAFAAHSVIGAAHLGTYTFLNFCAGHIIFPP